MFNLKDFETELTCDFTNFETEIARLESLDTYFYDAHFHQTAGYVGWKVSLVREADEKGTYVLPQFSHPQWNPYYKILNLRILIEPVNHLDSTNKEFNYSDRLYWIKTTSITGKKMYLSEILDTKNGWIKDETFTVKVGIYVESLLNPDGCWRFNVLNKPFELKSKGDVVNIYPAEGNLRVVCHIQLLQFHCPSLSDKMNAKNRIRGIPHPNYSKFCIDILHGVQLKVEPHILFDVIDNAKFLGLDNVLRYCELQLIEDVELLKGIENRILFAIKLNFNRYLVFLLKELETNALIKLLKMVDTGKMSGESMKICLQKILYDCD